MADFLLAIDIGNTETSIGVFSGEELTGTWRLRTGSYRTPDEWKFAVGGILKECKLKLDDFKCVIISSVVPAASNNITGLFEKEKTLILNNDTPAGLKISIDNPSELGADRIANAVGAHTLYKKDLFVVDFGTATTIDAVSQNNEYLGGIIAPGIEISSDALFKSAAKLNHVSLEFPANILGKNTSDSIRSGILYGTISQIEGLIGLLSYELNWKNPVTIATGGLAGLIFGKSLAIEYHEPHLTLKGLKFIYDIAKSD